MASTPTTTGSSPLARAAAIAAAFAIVGGVIVVPLASVFFEALTEGTPAYPMLTSEGS